MGQFIESKLIAIKTIHYLLSGRRRIQVNFTQVDNSIQ